MAEKSRWAPNLLKGTAAIAAAGSIAVPAAALALADPLIERLEGADLTEASGEAQNISQVEASIFMEREAEIRKSRKSVRYWYGPQDELAVLKRLGTAKNAKLAFVLAKKRSWYNHTQVGCVDRVWYEESKFDVHAANPYSAARGIPQADPGDKMASAGKDWPNNATTQINWGYTYDEDRYETPCGAEAFRNRHGYY